MDKKTGKRFLAILLTLAMLTGLLPAVTVTAAASGNTAPIAGFGQAMSVGDTFATVVPAEDGSQDITGAFTVEMWIKKTRADAAAYVFARNGGSGQWAVLADADGYEFFTSAAGLGTIAKSRIAVRDTNWHHIAYTYNGSVLAFYLDGVKTESTELAVGLPNATHFCIGNALNGRNPIYGTLDELRLWNICRSGDDILADMYRSISATDDDYDNLVFYCKFEEGSGQNIKESIKNVSGTVYQGNHPTVETNGAWAESAPISVRTAEDTAVSGSLIGYDVDGDALTYSVVSSGSNGVAEITSDNQFTYTPDDDFNGVDYFTYKVTDTNGAESAAQEVAVTVTPVNDAPVLTPATPVLTAIMTIETDNNGQTVSSFADSTISDADTDSLKGIAIVATADEGGKWQYSTDGGSGWTDVGEVSLTGALLLRSSDFLRFVPGEPDDAVAEITYCAWDRTTVEQEGSKVNVTTSGGVTAFSSATDTASLVVAATPFYIGNAMNYGKTDDSLSSQYLTTQLDNITMEVWVRPDELLETAGGYNTRVMYNGDSRSSGYGIYIQNRVPCILMGGVSFAFASGVTLTTSQWYHLAAVRASGVWTLYVNGTGYTPTNHRASPAALSGSETFTVGNSSYASENFKGSIDEVRFWTVARTAQQIKDNMYIKQQGDEGGLLAYYNFDQEEIIPNGTNTGITTVTDVAGGNNNLTIYNFARTGNTSNFVQSVQLGTFSLSANAYSCRKDDGSVTITVVRTGGSEGSVTINCKTADGTALAGTDYTYINKSVTFAAGEVSKEVSVPILNNPSADAPKTFSFSISGSPGVPIGTQSSAAVNIMPPAPTLGLNYSAETITGVASGMEYVVDTSATAAGWTDAAEINSSTALDISEHIAASGNTAKYIHIRVKAVGEGVPGTAANIMLSARPAATGFIIDYSAETTTAEVPAAVEYNTEPLGGTWTPGTGTALALTPGTTYYFRTAATDSSFAGEVQTLTVPSRPATPTDTDIMAVSAAGKAGLSTKLTFTYSSGSYEYAIVADGSVPTDASWVVVPFSGTAIDNISGRTATDDVYIRVKAGASSFVSESYKILDSLNISKNTYSGTQAATPAVSSKTDVKVVLTAVAVQGQTVEYAKNTENTAPEGGWQDSTTFDGLRAGTDYCFFARVKENLSHQAGPASDALSVTTKTAPANAPDVSPSAVTTSSVTLPYNVLWEYKLSTEEAWQSCEEGISNEFTGLNAATPYTFHIRVKETDGGMPSVTKEITLYTRPATPTADDFSVTQPTTANGGKSKGRVEAADGKTASDYEYRIMIGDEWPEAWRGLGTTPLTAIDAPAAIELRVKAAGSVPESAAYTVTIYKYIPPYIPIESANVPVIVDGKKYNIGTVKTKDNVTTFAIDRTMLQKQLDAAGDSVVVPVSPVRQADTVVAQLAVANVEEMAEKGMTLSVRVDNVSYELPAVAIDTAALMAELGATNPAKVPLYVTIRELTVDDVSLESGELMLPPVEFTVTAGYDGKSAETKVFEKYVRRIIEISDDVDPEKITTAVVIENGRQRHVPTEVFQKDGKWYARINSLTNSIYALIFNEVSFTDDDGKWFEPVVAEMAGRGIVNGRGEGIFDGAANTTRAEFAAIIVRALGLPENGDASMFTDVPETAWYCGAVGKAYEYGLVDGRGGDIFDPTAYITRQEAMAMVRRAATITEFEGTTVTLDAFSDADSVSAWALADAQWNVGSGLVQGNDAGMIRGQDSITRGETATIVLRLLQKSGLVDMRAQA